MAVWSPLTTHYAVTSESQPRSSKIDGIGHHHAASTSLSTVLALAQPGGRDVSMNYVIYKDQIWGVVPEDRRAYTSASRQDDDRSITYEIINSSTGPDWTFDPVTLATVARLDADITARYGVKQVHALPGYWEHSDLYTWFGRSYPTACAGPSFHIDRQITAAKAISAGSGDKEDIMKRFAYRSNIRKELKPGEWTTVHINDTGNAASFAAGQCLGVVNAYIQVEGLPVGEGLKVRLLKTKVGTNESRGGIAAREVPGTTGTTYATVSMDFQLDRPDDGIRVQVAADSAGVTMVRADISGLVQ